MVKSHVIHDGVQRLGDPFYECDREVSDEWLGEKIISVLEAPSDANAPCEQLSVLKNKPWFKSWNSFGLQSKEVFICDSKSGITITPVEHKKNGGGSGIEDEKIVVKKSPIILAKMCKEILGVDSS